MVNPCTNVSDDLALAERAEATVLDEPAARVLRRFRQDMLSVWHEKHFEEPVFPTRLLARRAVQQGAGGGQFGLLCFGNLAHFADLRADGEQFVFGGFAGAVGVLHVAQDLLGALLGAIVMLPFSARLIVNGTTRPP